MNILNEIGPEAALGQLAEEAAELAQAALKMQRILCGKNPTPVTMEQARRNLTEEAVDVAVCLTVLKPFCDAWDEDTYNVKLDRWANRIREANVNGVNE